jgi:hypothetical protein
MTPTTPIGEGEHNVTATQIGTNGVTSAVSPTAPLAPVVVITEDTNNDGNISKTNELDGDVNVTITLPVNAEVGDTLNITNPDGSTTEVTVTQALIDNGYTTTYPVPSDATPMVVTATLTDSAGNEGAEGNDTAILLDDVAPLAPEITSIDENTSSTVATSETTPEINGTCEANLTVTVQIDGVDIDPSTTCSETGTFSVIPTNPIAEGEHNVTTSQVGENNVTSPLSPVIELIIDTTAPTVFITSTTPLDNGNVEVNGTTEAYATVTVTFDNNETVTVVADVNGNYSATSTTVQPTD